MKYDVIKFSILTLFSITYFCFTLTVRQFTVIVTLQIFCQKKLGLLSDGADEI